jgi:hypothetical protein
MKGTILPNLPSLPQLSIYVQYSALCSGADGADSELSAETSVHSKAECAVVAALTREILVHLHTNEQFAGCQTVWSI